MFTESLRKIGLSEGEIKIYTTLLEHGLSPINQIHEKIGIERRNIYDILNKLIEKGLVTYVMENKKRFFQVSNPNKIISYVEEKKHALDSIKEEVKKEIPNLMQKFNFKRLEISAEIYRGNEGVKAIWEDMLNYKEVRLIGSGRYVPKMLPHFFVNWNKRRIESGVRWFNLMRHEMRKEVKQMTLEEIKFLPKEFSGNPTVICVYGNKTVNFLFGKEFFAFVIESKDLADNYRIYHKYLWNNVAEH